jgi:D-glycero-alpha-D-manno-heptose-7-phosphate kinase
MIITRTPFRISFFGGGTDYPAWYKNHGGAVLATSIDKYCYISIRYLPPFFEHRHRIVYSKVEHVTSTSEIQHPTVRAILNEFNPIKGLEIHHDGDLPARAGLGSSSSFAVGLLNAMSALSGRRVTKQNLAERATYIEQKIMQENVGCQDQITTAYGGFNIINFEQDGTRNIAPIIASSVNIRNLEDSMMLFYTGVARFASEVAGEQLKNIGERFSELTQMHEMVEEGANILEQKINPVKEFGKLLHESWLLKKTLAKTITNPEIDHIYDIGLNAGAYGGKLLGAGGGGFILFIAPKEKHSKIKEALPNLVYVNFRFDHDGSKIIVYDPEEIDCVP